MGNRDAFDADAVRFLERLSSHIALAVDNTLHHEAAERAQQELARERDRLRLLLEVNNTLVSDLELRPLFGAIIGTLRKLVSHDFTTLVTWDEERQVLDLRALEFAGSGLVTERMSVPPEVTPAGIAFAAGQPMRFDRAVLTRMPHDFVRRLLAEGVQSLCCVPLTVRNHRLGTLNVGRRSGEPFTDEDVELLAAVGNQIALAVENSLAFQQTTLHCPA